MSNVPEVFCEPVSRPASRLINVQRMAERAGEAIETLLEKDDDGACENGGVGDVRTSAAALAGARPRAKLGCGVRETVNREVTQDAGWFKEGKG